MISEIEVKKGALSQDSGFEYAKKIGAIKSLKFGDGLNLILGNNGSGKSTLARMIAAGCWADRAGFPHMTRMAMEARTADSAQGRMKLDGVKVAHDGQVLYIDSASTPDPETNMGAFVRSFVSGRMQLISHGERTYKAVEAAFLLMRQVAEPEKHRSLEDLVEVRLKRYKNRPSDTRINEIRKEELEKLAGEGLSPFRAFPQALNDLGADSKNWYKGSDAWAKSMRKRMEAALENFSPALPKSKPTLLLDEPERSLSLVAQANLWSLICDPKVIAAYQIIVVSHSLFALEAYQNIKGVNAIEMSSNFAESTLKYVGQFRERIKPV